MDGQNSEAMSDVPSDNGSAQDSSSSEDNVPLDRIRHPQVARRKSRAQPPQAVDLSEDDLDSEDENCPPKSNVSQNRQIGDSEIILISKMANQVPDWDCGVFPAHNAHVLAKFR